MLAANQREQELKFELLVADRRPEPTAVASFNYHQDHFARVYGLGMADGGVAHTGLPRASASSGSRSRCSARHGLDLGGWPDEVREELWR